MAESRFAIPISVIVPFYNIKSCVDYCLASLLAQDYRGKFELVLVDDGSTDGTGSRLDGYANFPNVKVIHQANGGLSRARNHGVAIARYGYVTFVDGDDIVAPWYLSTLAAGMPSDGDALVSSQPVDIPIAQVGSFEWGSEDFATFEELEPGRALECVLYNERIKTSACGKLAPKGLYERFPFPEGAYYEEIATAGQFITGVSRVVATDAGLYGYVMRPGSIVHRRDARLKQVIDYLEAVRSIVGVAKASGACGDAIVFHRCLQYARIIQLASAVTDDRGLAARIADECRSYVRSRLTRVFLDGSVSLGNKARFLVLAASRRLYVVLMKVHESLRKGVR